MDTFKFINKNQLNNDMDSFNILDIRPVEKYTETGSFNKFITVEEINSVSKDDKIIVVCNKGISAQGVAEELIKLEFDDVYVLEGGAEEYFS